MAKIETMVKFPERNDEAYFDKEFRGILSDVRSRVATFDLQLKVLQKNGDKDKIASTAECNHQQLVDCIKETLERLIRHQTEVDMRISRHGGSESRLLHRYVALWEDCLETFRPTARKSVLQCLHGRRMSCANLMNSMERENFISDLCQYLVPSSSSVQDDSANFIDQLMKWQSTHRSDNILSSPSLSVRSGCSTSCGRLLKAIMCDIKLLPGKTLNCYLRQEEHPALKSHIASMSIIFFVDLLGETRLPSCTGNNGNKTLDYQSYLIGYSESHLLKQPPINNELKIMVAADQINDKHTTVTMCKTSFVNDSADTPTKFKTSAYIERFGHDSKGEMLSIAECRSRGVKSADKHSCSVLDAEQCCHISQTSAKYCDSSTSTTELNSSIVQSSAFNLKQSEYIKKNGSNGISMAKVLCEENVSEVCAEDAVDLSISTSTFRTVTSTCFSSNVYEENSSSVVKFQKESDSVLLNGEKSEILNDHFSDTKDMETNSHRDEMSVKSSVVSLENSQNDMKMIPTYLPSGPTYNRKLQVLSRAENGEYSVVKSEKLHHNRNNDLVVVCMRNPANGVVYSAQESTANGWLNGKEGLVKCFDGSETVSVAEAVDRDWLCVHTICRHTPDSSISAVQQMAKEQSSVTANHQMAYDQEISSSSCTYTTDNGNRVMRADNGAGSTGNTMQARVQIDVNPLREDRMIDWVQQGALKRSKQADLSVSQKMLEAQNADLSIQQRIKLIKESCDENKTQKSVKNSEVSKVQMLGLPVIGSNPESPESSPRKLNRSTKIGKIISCFEEAKKIDDSMTMNELLQKIVTETHDGNGNENGNGNDSGNVNDNGNGNGNENGCNGFEIVCQLDDRHRIMQDQSGSNKQGGIKDEHSSIKLEQGIIKKDQNSLRHDQGGNIELEQGSHGTEQSNVKVEQISVKQRLVSFEQEQSSVKNEQGGVEKWQGSMKKEQSTEGSLKQDQGSIEQGQDSMKEGHRSMKEGPGSIKQRLTNAEQEQNCSKQEQDSISKDLTSIETQQSSIKLDMGNATLLQGNIEQGQSSIKQNQNSINREQDSVKLITQDHTNMEKEQNNIKLKQGISEFNAEISPEILAEGVKMATSIDRKDIVNIQASNSDIVDVAQLMDCQVCCEINELILQQQQKSEELMKSGETDDNNVHSVNSRVTFFNSMIHSDNCDKNNKNLNMASPSHGRNYEKSVENGSCSVDVNKSSSPTTNLDSSDGQSIDNYVNILKDLGHSNRRQNILDLLESSMDTSQPLYENGEGCKVSVKDAVLDGCLDLSDFTFCDSSTLTKKNLSKAAREGDVEVSAVAGIINTMKNFSLESMMTINGVFPKLSESEKQAVMSRSSPITLKDAAEQGLVDPSAIFLLDCSARVRDSNHESKPLKNNFADNAEVILRSDIESNASNKNRPTSSEKSSLDTDNNKNNASTRLSKHKLNKQIDCNTDLKIDTDTSNKEMIAGVEIPDKMAKNDVRQLHDRVNKDVCLADSGPVNNAESCSINNAESHSESIDPVIISLDMAMSRGLIDSQTGCFVDPNSGKTMELGEALSSGFIKTWFTLSDFNLVECLSADDTLNDKPTATMNAEEESFNQKIGADVAFLRPDNSNDVSHIDGPNSKNENASSESQSDARSVSKLPDENALVNCDVTSSALNGGSFNPNAEMHSESGINVINDNELNKLEELSDKNQDDLSIDTQLTESDTIAFTDGLIRSESNAKDFQSASVIEQSIDSLTDKGNYSITDGEDSTMLSKSTNEEVVLDMLNTADTADSSKSEKIEKLESSLSQNAKVSDTFEQNKVEAATPLKLYMDQKASRQKSVEAEKFADKTDSEKTVISDVLNNGRVIDTDDTMSQLDSKSQVLVDENVSIEDNNRVDSVNTAELQDLMCEQNLGLKISDQHKNLEFSNNGNIEVDSSSRTCDNVDSKLEECHLMEKQLCGNNDPENSMINNDALDAKLESSSVHTPISNAAAGILNGTDLVETENDEINVKEEVLSMEAQEEEKLLKQKTEQLIQLKADLCHLQESMNGVEFSSIESLDDLIYRKDTLQKIKNEIDQKREPVENIRSSSESNMESLVSVETLPLHVEVVQIWTKLEDEATVKANQLEALIDSTMLLEEKVEHFVPEISECKEISSKLIPSNIDSLESCVEMLKSFKDLDELLKQKKSTVVELMSCHDDALVKAKELISNDTTLTHGSYDAVVCAFPSTVETKISYVVTNYEELTISIPATIEKMEKACRHWEKYQNKNAELCERLYKVEEILASNGSDMESNGSLASENIEELNKLKNDLQNLSAEVFGDLQSIGCAQQAEQIVQESEKLAMQCDTACRDLHQKMNENEAEEAELDSTGVFIERCESIVSEPASLDAKVLQKQTKEASEAQDEAKSRRARLQELLARRTGSAAEIKPVAQVDEGNAAGKKPTKKSSFEDLMGKLESLEGKLSEKKDHLQDLSAGLEKINGMVTSLDEWYNNMVESLEKENENKNNGEAEGSESDVKNLMKIYEEVTMRRSDVEALEKDLGEFIDGIKVETKDKSQWRNGIVQAHSRYHDLTDMVGKRAELLAGRKLDEAGLIVKELDTECSDEINDAMFDSSDNEDLDSLNQKLSDLKEFHFKLKERCDWVNDVSDSVSQLIHSSVLVDSAVQSKLISRSNELTTRCDQLVRASQKKLETLETVVPLVNQLMSDCAELRSSLNDLSSVVERIEVPTNENIELIRDELVLAKNTMEHLIDRKDLMVDLLERGQQVLDLTGQQDVMKVMELTSDLSAVYEEMRSKAKLKMDQLHDALYTSANNTSEAADSCLDKFYCLSDQIENLQPISCSIDTILEQIEENQTLTQQLSDCAKTIESLKEMAEKLKEEKPSEGGESMSDSISDPHSQESMLADLISKIEDLESLHTMMNSDLNLRAKKLEEAASQATAFEAALDSATSTLVSIQDSLAGIEPGLVDDSDDLNEDQGEDSLTASMECAGEEQRKQLLAIKEDVDKAEKQVVEVKDKASLLTQACDPPSAVKVKKQVHDLDVLMEEVQDETSRLDTLTERVVSCAQNYQQLCQAISGWLPQAEARFKSLTPVAADQRTVKIQMEELKGFTRQLYPRYSDVESLHRCSSEIHDLMQGHTRGQAGKIERKAVDTSMRWNKLLKDIEQREGELQEALVELGELDVALDEVTGLLQQAEADIQHLEVMYADPSMIETHLKKVQMLYDKILVQNPALDKLGERIDKVIKSSGQKSTPLLAKLSDAREAYGTVEQAAREKKNTLRDRLAEVKCFIGNVEELTRWMTSYSKQLKSTALPGALPKSAQAEYDKFMERHGGLERKVEEASALILNGADMCSRCRGAEAVTLKQKLSALGSATQEALSKSKKEQTRLLEHVENVRLFHSALGAHEGWMDDSELKLGKARQSSKLVDTVLEQISDHNQFKIGVESHKDLVANLDLTGTYLKYFGCPKDTTAVKQQLMTSKLRWKRLLRRVDERGRTLQRAYREDERFYAGWKTMFDWLDDIQRRISKCIPTSSGTTNVDHSLEELKRLRQEVSSRSGAYYATLRQGRSLRDRCTSSDPELDVLSEQLEHLKSAWRDVASEMTLCESKLFDALSVKKKLSVSANSLLSSLIQAKKTSLSDDHPIHGDMQTVSMIIEQHKEMVEDLEKKWQTVNSLMSQVELDSSIKDQLMTLHRDVEELKSLRSAKLNEALALAKDFEEAVNSLSASLHSTLSDAEAIVLTLGEESLILGSIEQARALGMMLAVQEENFEAACNMADDIIARGCHPNAVPVVRQQKASLLALWTKVKKQVKQKEDLGQAALRRYHSEAALVEELIDWTTQHLAWLKSPENNSTPEDLVTADIALKEYMEFNSELMEKKKLVDKFVPSKPDPNQPKSKIPKMKLGFNSYSTAAESNGSVGKTGSPTNPRTAILRTKWDLLWKIASERRNKLQDSFSHQLALKALSSFDFSVWRRRYVAWLRAKKFRLTDFFRTQNRGQGTINRKDFVEGMLATRFKSNAMELNAVFDAIDKDQNEEITYQEFIDALKIDKKQLMRPITDSEQIHENIEHQVEQCRCAKRYPVQKVVDGKYKFGERGKLYLVRFLNSTVMVRVGGGWVTLEKFLESNDPCRAKGRMNTELRERFILPDGASQSRVAFTKRRTSTQSSDSDCSGSQPGSRARTPDFLGRASSSSRASPASLRRPSNTGSKTPLSIGSVTPSGTRTPCGIKANGVSTPCTSSRTEANGITTPCTSSKASNVQTSGSGVFKCPAPKTTAPLSSVRRASASNTSESCAPGRGKIPSTGIRTPSSVKSMTPSGSRTQSPLPGSEGSGIPQAFRRKSSTPSASESEGRGVRK